jgi:putative sugar O-methyltransferase
MSAMRTPADPSLTQLRQAYDRTLAYIEKVSSSEMTGYTSAFWTEILADRASYPAFDEMLMMRRGATYPMGERRDVADIAAERKYADAAYAVATRSIPKESSFLASLEEPPLGCPRSFEMSGKQLTANCLVNAVTVYSLLEALTRSGLSEKPLRVLEIGAGFGQAARLIMERLDVTSYVICDLPENLFLGAFYLQGLFPERQVAFIDRETADPGNALAFVVPPFAETLEGPFDLILNSYSFQEMNRASVEGYFALAARTLAPDGVFYSLNSHGKDEISWPSEYPVGSFHIERLALPRKFPFQLNATIPYELVLRGKGEGDSRTPASVAVGLDGIGCAFQLGLDEELEGLSEEFVGNSLDTATEGWLVDLAGLFRAPGLDEKRVHMRALRASNLFPGVSAYLGGCLAYVSDDPDDTAGLLSEALTGLGASLARVHAEAMLATTDAGGNATGAATRLAPHLAAQVAELSTTQAAYARHIRACLRFGTDEAPVPGRIRRGVRRIGRSIPMPLR